ncbi:MAG: hypothetical protein LBL24_02645 [Bacteroidales bacterium]|nr:hypothetical protein [Bacteroidales bacterium]
MCHAESCRKKISGVCKITKAQIKFAGRRFVTKKAAAEKFQMFVRLQKHKSNFREVFVSCRKLPQKNSDICKITKAQIKFSGDFCVMQKAAAEKFRHL